MSVSLPMAFAAEGHRAEGKVAKAEVKIWKKSYEGWSQNFKKSCEGWSQNLKKVAKAEVKI